MRSIGRIARAGAALLLLAAFLFPMLPALAQDQSPANPPPQVQQLLDLLSDPAVRDWISQHGNMPAAAATAPAAAPEVSPSSYLANRLAEIRRDLAALAVELPKLPGELDYASRILAVEFQDRGLFSILLLVAGFVGLGYGAQWLFWIATKGVRARLIAMPLDTVGNRLQAVLMRLGFGMGMATTFAIGSVGCFILLDWPLLLREIVLGYLMAFLILRIAIVICRFLLAPGGERFRIVPMSTEAAYFWYRRIATAVGWFAFSWVTVGLLDTLGVSDDGRRVVAYGAGLILLAIGLEAVWRRPAVLREITEADVEVKDRFVTVSAAVSAYFFLLWLLWVATAMPAFWFVVVVITLPAAIRTARQSVNHILRPPGSSAESEIPTVQAVLLERGIRAVLIIGAALLLARAWHIDLTALAANDTVVTRLMRGAVSAVVILLIADFIWRLARALIDGKIAEAKLPGQPDTEEVRRRSRLRTLLPILRNILFVVLLAMSGLMVLSAMGVEIGPLIAGAGVVGVAVGFGAQTLVKDIISGMFYLLDDAFRVGEYIQSGSYKGTVESFSLRSVKLRHHRGPLYTVPFGELGAVENMSRDWVIDKMQIGVTYDTDLDKARKLIKQVGKELAEDPEYKPHIIEPLKMQGVEQFGDFAIQIRMKMTCKPGEQFVIRRKAFGLIKKAFDANGIKFAFPTVQVAGGDESAAAIAQQSLANAKAATAPE